MHMYSKFIHVLSVQTCDNVKSALHWNGNQLSIVCCSYLDWWRQCRKMCQMQMLIIKLLAGCLTCEGFFPPLASRFRSQSASSMLSWGWQRGSVFLQKNWKSPGTNIQKLHQTKSRKFCCKYLNSLKSELLIELFKWHIVKEHDFGAWKARKFWIP